MLSKYPEMLRRFNFRKVYWFREGVLWWCLIILGFQIFFCLFNNFVHLMTSHFSFKVNFLFLFFFPCHLLERILWAWPLEKTLRLWWWQEWKVRVLVELGKENSSSWWENTAETLASLHWKRWLLSGVFVFSGFEQVLKQTFPGSWGKTVNTLVYRTQSRKQAILGYRYRRVDTGNSLKWVIKRAKQ